MEALSPRFLLFMYVCTYTLCCRVTLLKNVPFLRFLTDEEKEIIIKDEKACQVL